MATPAVAPLRNIDSKLGGCHLDRRSSAHAGTPRLPGKITPGLQLIAAIDKVPV